MDMTDKQLLEHFMQPSREIQLADDGFSERVMRQLPDRKTRTLCHLWTVLCVVVAAVLFVVLQGWNIVVHGMLILLKSPLSNQQLLMLALSVGVVGLLAIHEIFSRERWCFV